MIVEWGEERRGPGSMVVLLTHYDLSCMVPGCRWHGVATWRWDVNDERCGICYNAFEACCPDCSAPGDDCPPGEFLSHIMDS